MKFKDFIAPPVKGISGHNGPRLVGFGYVLQAITDLFTMIFLTTFIALLIIICFLLCTENKSSYPPKEVPRRTTYGQTRADSQSIIIKKRIAEHEARMKLIRPIPGVAYSIRQVQGMQPPTEGMVKALRGGEFIGNRMRFKVKVVNETPYIITDVIVYLLSYPKSALRLGGKEHDCKFSKIEPSGFRSPSFDFLPTQDCVRGEIVAGVSYIDMRGKAHTLSTEPFVIRAVCDLLIPDPVSPDDFALKLQSHEHGDIAIKVDEWTPEEMFDKALKIVDESNFFEVSSELEYREGVAFGEITGYAKGKYTGKSVGVQINVTGPSNAKGASCTIMVSGEDEAMILPAIDDLKERLSAWLCPLCCSPLTLENVADLRDGKVIECPFCSVSIGR